MIFHHFKRLDDRKNADVLIIAFWKLKQGVESAVPLPKEISKLLEMALATGDFKGKEGELLTLYVDGKPEKRFCLLGLGVKEKMSVETLRRCYGGLAKSCLDKKLHHINLLIPDISELDENSLIRGIVEGILLPNYSYQKYKHREPDEQEMTLLQVINWIGSYANANTIAKEVLAICKGVYYVRDLVNDNADDATPQYLAKCANDIAEKYSSVKAVVFDKKRIEQEKMGLLLAVNRGSALDPAFIILEYHGNPESKDKTVIVGKGVTYDTGGLNIKPTGGMETMKCDMAGGAACLGTILALAQLKMKVNVTAVIPSTENATDANSFKPGDVYKSYSGKTVEMTNSDAEGRLILADALSYSIKNLQPSRIIDLATLTGAIEIALGSESAGLMSTSDSLAQALILAGDATFERLWRMPLYDEYKERLKSDIADFKSWNGRSGGANVAATFLRFFVDDKIPWAHIDIAGTAYVLEAKKYLPKYATGYGVRLIVEFLKNLAIDPLNVPALPASSSKLKSRKKAKKT